MAPITHASQVMWTAERSANSGFCRTRLTEYAAAATRQSNAPSSILSESTSLSPEPDNPMSATPANATSRPTTSGSVNFSPRNIAASTATSTGATWSSIAAVPASTHTSPWLSARW